METLNVLSRIRDQLPAQVQSLVQVSLKSDAFMLRPTVVFKTRDGQLIETPLEDNLVIPTVVLGRLCLL